MKIFFDKRPATANSALAISNHQIFPAVHPILTILLNTLVGNVSCERSFSAEASQVVEPVYKER